MTRDKMTAMLSETLYVTWEEAAAALQAREWDVLAAARLLQKQAQARKLKAAPVSH